MTRPAEFPPVDIERLVEVLDRHGVDYILVGGGAGRMLGAERLTEDTDCLARRAAENLDRLGAAMRELSARLRVAGLTDAEAVALPVRVDGKTLAAAEISTWTTDAGRFDVLMDIPARDGRRLRYEDVLDSVVTVEINGAVLRVASLDVIIASKEWADRPKDHQALPELRRLRDGLPEA